MFLVYDLSVSFQCDKNFVFDNREFDEGLLQRIPEISYEDDVKEIPSPPDVSNYLVSEVSHEYFCIVEIFMESQLIL